MSASLKTFNSHSWKYLPNNRQNKLKHKQQEQSHCALPHLCQRVPSIITDDWALLLTKLNSPNKKLITQLSVSNKAMWSVSQWRDSCFMRARMHVRCHPRLPCVMAVPRAACTWIHCTALRDTTVWATFFAPVIYVFFIKQQTRRRNTDRTRRNTMVYAFSEWTTVVLRSLGWSQKDHCCEPILGRNRTASSGVAANVSLIRQHFLFKRGSLNDLPPCVKDKLDKAVLLTMNKHTDNEGAAPRWWWNCYLSEIIIACAMFCLRYQSQRIFDKKRPPSPHAVLEISASLTHGFIFHCNKRAPLPRVLGFILSVSVTGNQLQSNFSTKSDETQRSPNVQAVIN